MPRGRPKKYLSAKDAAEARRERNRQYYIRKRQTQAPPEVTSYAPTLPGAPTPTPLDLGIRISVDVPLPRDSLVQPDELEDDEDVYRPPSPLAPLAEDDVETAAVISQRQASDKEQIDERDEYEQRVLQQMNATDSRTAEILLEMQAGIAQTRTSANKILGQQEDIGRPANVDNQSANAIAGHSKTVESSNLQRLSAAPVAEEPAVPVELPSASNARSVGNLSTITLAVAANTSAETLESVQTPSHRGLNSPQTPSQRGSAASAQSSKRSGQRKTSFPVQSNTLLSWVRPASRQPSEGNSTPQPALLSSGHSTPQPLPPSSNRSTPLQPLPPFNSGTSNLSQPPTSISTPQPSVRGTPAAASPSPSIRAGDVSNPVSAQAASPAQSTPRTDSPATPPTERTAYKLAKQLRKFQGCTHEEHAEAERRHQEHHERPDVHSRCSCLQEITSLVSGVHNRAMHLPVVLDNPRLMTPSDLLEGVDLEAAFEGTSPAAYPEDVGTPNEKLPRSLCLEQHYHSSRKGRAAQVTFDIDSVCCFPNSLAFARNGINWYPRAHPIFNLDADIHFSLTVSAYNNRGDLTTRSLPLHKIPHYCFGTVAGSIQSLQVFIFFPELHLRSEYEHSNYLSKQDQQLWLDAALLPALRGLGLSASRMKYYPASEDNVSIGVTTVSGESLTRTESAREQLLAYTLPHEYLDRLWTSVLERIAEDPGLSRFNNATLFAHAKNTKLAHMADTTDDLVVTYKRWEKVWAEVADPQFYSRDRVYVDVAKEVSSEDYAHPYDSVPDSFEAETFLWKRCCLESYARTRVKLLEDGKRARGSPRVTVYPWATMRDTIGQTMSTVPRGQENLDGLAYSQFYATIKTPFDVSKVYVFDNQAIENLALDPGYVRSLQQQGGGVTFSERLCKNSYVHSKTRASSNLRDNQRRSYGIREEHRVSLTLIDEICEQWQAWDLYDDSIDNIRSPLPYYIVPSQELFRFLHSQINKFCFLFEYTLVHTSRTYSLPETIVMVVALRALRFCYGSNLLARELLLYKDRWELTRGQAVVVKEGLGMQKTMERCGLGWFLPKFSWATRRLAQPHGDNMLVGNLLMHAEYKRRWRAVKDLRDVFVRFNQATGWYQQYSVQQRPALLEKWLEYLHALNLEQFDSDVWSSMLSSHKSHVELSPIALAKKGNIVFGYQSMQRLFLENGVIVPPHIVTGNKMRFPTVDKLLDFLFRWDDEQKRGGWGARPYRLILRKSFEFIERQLGHSEADKWLDEFFYLIRLTHWILPYPSSQALIESTKESHAQRLTRRTMWFSAVYADPSMVALPFKEPPKTIVKLVYRAHRQSIREGAHNQGWETKALIRECRKQGLPLLGVDVAEEHWIAGRMSAGTKGFMPLWERGKPPSLLMRERIRGLSLDELDGLMVAFTQEQAATEEEMHVDAASEDANSEARPTPLVSIREVAPHLDVSATPSRRSLSVRHFFQHSREERSESGSVFVPSTDRG